MLDRGPGHYAGSGLPGRRRAVAIAGHRVTHTRPFLRINELKHGQRIVLTRRSQRFVYRVSAMRVVEPTNVWPIRMRPTVQRLVLTACHPPHSARYRLVVFAKLVDAFGWGWNEIRWATINGMKSAFLPFDQRLHLINEVIKPWYADNASRA